MRFSLNATDRTIRDLQIRVVAGVEDGSTGEKRAFGQASDKGQVVAHAGVENPYVLRDEPEEQQCARE
jgi:hypothetical protein